MGIFSSPKPLKSPSRLESAGVATLGGVQVSLTLLEKLMDGTPIPFVKGAIGTALEIIKLSKGIQSDKEDCDNLIKRTTSLLIVILDSLKGKTEEQIPTHIKRAVGRLSTNFQEVLDELRIIDKRTGKQSSMRMARAILYHFDNTEKLKGCSSKLDWAINEFQVTSKVDSCLKDLERHEELRMGQTELRLGQVSLQEGQTVLQTGQVKIQDELVEIREVMKGKISGNALQSLPSTVMPSSPRIFGRQSYINKVVQLLLSAISTHLVILGPGGIGKTSVALSTVHDSCVIERFGIYRRWVPCEQATSLPLFFELIAKSLGLPPSTTNDRFSEIVAALEESGVLQFVLFDNFETIWDLEGEQSAIANILARLVSIPSLSFILTMRGIQHPASNLIDWTSPRLPPLTPLEMDPAQEAFLKISPDSEGDDNLPELLRELDCMPLAITLMAKLAEVGETVAELLSQWKQEQVKLLSQPGGDRTSSIEVSIRLSLTSLPVRTNADAIPLLSILARLPGGASLTQLPTICPSIPGWKAALRVLRTAALVYDSPDKTVVRILSPIRSYVLLHHPIAEGTLQDLRTAYYDLANKGRGYTGEPEFDNAVADLSKEEINLDTIILDALKNAVNKEDAIAAAFSYTNYLSFAQPRVNVIERAIQVARDTGSDLLATCLQCYGDTLRYQSQYDVASLALEEARDRQFQLGNKTNSAYCSMLIGEILRAQNKYVEACSRVEEAEYLFLEIHEQNGATNCRFLLGYIYEAQGKLESAKSTWEEAISRYAELQDQVGVASCLLTLGKVYRTQGQYEAAYSAAEEAKSIYIKFRVLQGVANTLLLFGDIHFDRCQYSEAYSAAAEARAIYVKRGDKLGIALSLSSMGNIIFKQERYVEAQRCTEETKDEWVKLGNNVGIANCWRLFGDIYWMKGEYDEACCRLEEAKSLFAKHNNGLNSSLGIADCNSSLGKIFRLQGQYDNAIKLLEEARMTYSTLGSKEKDAAECTEEIALALQALGSREHAD